MRKHFIVYAALAAAALVSCTKEISEVKNPEKTKPLAEGITINVVSGSNATKTEAVDGTTPSIRWVDTDKISLFEIYNTTTVNEQATSENAEIEAGKASFKTTLTKSAPAGATSYQYAAVYPASAVSEGGSAPNKFYRILMPANQTLTGNNFSTDSDILFSAVNNHGDSRVANDESLHFQFRRLGTVIRLNLKGITAGEKIQKVILTAPMNVAGYIKYNPVEGKVDPTSAFYASASKTITLTVSDVVATGDDVVWFRIMSAEETWAANSELSIEVETDMANYYRNGRDDTHQVISLPQDFKFFDGGLTKMNIGLASYRVEKSAATRYTEVTDNGNIMEDAVYLITATSSEKTYAMGAYNSSYYGKVDVDKTVVNEKNCIDIQNEAVLTVTLEDAGNGAFYIKDSEDNYLYWESGNSVSRGEKGDADKYKWTVVCNGITNVGTTDRKLKYNSGSPRFACYTSAQTDIALYVDETTLAALEDAGLAYSVVSPVNVAWDERGSFVKPVLTNPNNLTVTYASSNTAVATVDENTGDVTFVGNGSTTITASSEKTAQYKAGSASYQITVTGKPAEAKSLPYNNTLINSHEDFTVNDISTGSLSAIWSDSNYGVQANAYQTTSDVETYLESPLIDLTSVSDAKLAFTHGINYFADVATAKTQATLQVRVQGGEWENVEIPTYPAALGNTTADAEVGLQAYAGNVIQFRFKYLATSTKPGRWQIKNLSVTEFNPSVPVINVTSANPMAVSNANDLHAVEYTITNPVGGKSISAVSNVAWIHDFDYSTEGEVSFEVDAQATDADARSGEITLSYDGATDVVVTVNQAAGPSSSSTSTSTLTFTSACNGSGTADDGAEWTVTSDGEESSYDNTKGIHYGTGSKAVQYIKLTTSGIKGTITKVVVNASTANGVTATVDVTVGGSAFGGDPQSLSTSAANYTFNGSASGEIIVTVTKPASATKALYVKSIAVTYE